MYFRTLKLCRFQVGISSGRRLLPAVRTMLGGLNTHGQPNLRVVRCEQETTFAYGRTIQKYFVPGGAKAIRERYFRKRHIFTGEVSECTRDEAKEIYERSAKADITNHYI